MCQCVTCVSSTDFFAPALPAQLFFSQHLLFCSSVLGACLAVWVTLALQNMPPKARAPEARICLGGTKFGVEFCTCSGPSRCLPTVQHIGVEFPAAPRVVFFSLGFLGHVHKGLSHAKRPKSTIATTISCHQHKRHEGPHDLETWSPHQRSLSHWAPLPSQNTAAHF